MTFEKQRTLLTLALIIAVGFLVLFLRNPDPIVHPTLFAEDAQWVWYLLENGRQTAYFYSRPDYLVLGQTAMLDIALQASLLVGGGTLVVLPQAVAFISYAFWAGLAALGYLSLTPWMSAAWRIAVAAGILLLPLGGHMNEIVGRVLNLGYLFLPLAFFLCLLREARHGRTAATLLVAGLVVCIFTNPIAVAVVGIHLGLRLIRRIFRRENLPWTGDLILGIAILAFVALFLSRLGSDPAGASVPFVAERFVELAGARSLLFPLVFNFYSMLNDRMVIAMVSAFAAIVGLAIALSPPRQRLFGICLLAVTVGSTAIVVLTRPFLSGILSGYGTSFPDRYYMAQNIFAFVLFAWAISRFPFPIRILGVLVIFVCVLPGAGRLFEFGRPQMAIATNGTFLDQVVAALERDDEAEGDTPLLVDAYPEGWSFAMPASLARRTAELARLEAPASGGDRIDLGPLPYQWGLSHDRPAHAASLPLDAEMQEADVHNFVREGDRLRGIGQRPNLTLDLSALGSRTAGRPLLAFDLICESRTRFVDMQVYWTTPEAPDFAEARSVYFHAGPGRNIVPLDSHPAFDGDSAISALRLDIAGRRACAQFGFENVGLSRR